VDTLWRICRSRQTEAWNINTVISIFRGFKSPVTTPSPTKRLDANAAYLVKDAGAAAAEPAESSSSTAEYPA
jgi:hypothetical protein